MWTCVSCKNCIKKIKSWLEEKVIAEDNSNKINFIVVVSNNPNNSFKKISSDTKTQLHVSENINEKRVFSKYSKHQTNNPLNINLTDKPLTHCLFFVFNSIATVISAKKKIYTKFNFRC